MWQRSVLQLERNDREKSRAAATHFETTMGRLKGISPLISPELLHTLCSMGHGDELGKWIAPFRAISERPSVRKRVNRNEKNVALTCGSPPLDDCAPSADRVPLGCGLFLSFYALPPLVALPYLFVLFLRPRKWNALFTRAQFVEQHARSVLINFNSQFEYLTAFETDITHFNSFTHFCNVFQINLFSVKKII